MSGLRAHHPTVVLYGSNTAVVCDLSGQIAADEMQGFFAGDTRVLSTYKFHVSGSAWRVLGRSHLGHGTAQWEFQNPLIRDATGEIPSGAVSFGLRRRVAGAVHDDLSIQSFATRPVRLQLIVQLDADFADIFEVKGRSMPPRMDLRRIVGENSLGLVYEGRHFRRALHVRLQCKDAAPAFVGSRIGFDIALDHGVQWDCCIECVPEIDGERIGFPGDPHEPEPDPVSRSGHASILRAPLLAGPYERGQADLHALAVQQADGPPFVAAGAPWFLSLFGRDSLVAAMMSGIDGSWSAEGCLAALGGLQGRQRDDFRDEEPGKIPHELRRDEFTRIGDLPYSPYYGSHDAPALYCLALWHAWRWIGNKCLLVKHLDTARKAMRWCDELGDRDGDGLQEYATRSRKGYRNQGWKDAGDAVIDAHGRQAKPPIGTIELQGYLFAARIAMAELVEATGEHREAQRFRDHAWTLRGIVEERFWLEEENFYGLAVNGDKRSVDAITSNPGHLLWCGLPDPGRAEQVAKRLLKPDLFSGWGLRTLSSDNPAYNPLSYQLGSVWPHDTVIAAAGLWRYGLREPASVLIHAILRAAEALEDDRLPELFCGLDDSCGFPVPYEEANIPQAWAAAVPLLVTQLFLGLLPDAPRRRCYVSPWLPPWLPRLEARGIVVGEGILDIIVARHADETVIEKADGSDLEIIQDTADAPLWGTPPR